MFFWDINKAESNLKKHGVSFEVAQTVFEDPLHLSILDEKHIREERWITMGMTFHKEILVLVHTFQDFKNHEVIRIISARKATHREVKHYEERI